MDTKGFKSLDDLRGRVLGRVSEFKNFDLAFRAVARINPETCIKCNLCYVACNDTAHQCIDLIGADGKTVEPLAYDVRSNGKNEAVNSRPQPRVREEDCVGCRLCYNVCPVHNCIEMVELPPNQPSVTWDELSKTQREVTDDWEAMDRYRAAHGIHIH